MSRFHQACASPWVFVDTTTKTILFASQNQPVAIPLAAVMSGVGSAIVTVSLRFDTGSRKIVFMGPAVAEKGVGLSATVVMDDASLRNAIARTLVSDSRERL